MNNVTQIKIPRSYKKVKTTRTFTMNAYDFVPFFNMEIIPNDLIKINLQTVTNMQTPNFATMDTLYQHIAFFYCPNRLVLDNWDKFYGEGKNADYEEYVETFIPQLKCPTNGWEVGTIADYLTVPTGKKVKDVSALPFRMIAMIYNEYFRDEQRMAKALVSKNDTDQQGTNGDNYVNDLQNGGKVPKTCRLFDYFTGSKLKFQAGDPILIPIGDTAPVMGNGYPIGMIFEKGQEQPQYISNNVSGVEYGEGKIGIGNVGNNNQYVELGSDESHAHIAVYGGKKAIYGVTENPDYSGLVADLSEASAISERDLRLAFMNSQILRSIEDGGSRYIEQLYKRWGVRANELELEIPMFLGARKTLLNMNMVAGTGQDNLGEFTGLSNTYDSGDIFMKRFKQHGYLFGIITIRPMQTYENGIDRTLTRKTIDDYYAPEKAYLGPDEIKNYEIYSDKSDNKDDEMFGVRDYGDELRFFPNKVMGQMRTNSQYSQAFKTYSINFAERPLNNEEFILGNKGAVDKTLKDESSTYHQFTVQAGINITMVRNLPKNPNMTQLIRL